MIEEKNENKKNDEDETVNKTFFLGKSKNRKRHQFYNIQKDTLFNIDYLEDEKIIAYEKFPKIDWQIESETKKIEDYVCNMATTFFRGRKYTAWYSTKIPIRLGPWKFNGLPGAILQIYDETGLFSWSVTKIKQVNTEEKLVLENDLKIISLREFVEKNEKSKNSKIDRMMLKFFDRGAEVVKSEYNRGREKTFEWEEEIKED
jgi:GLPGLI family protein